MTRRAFTAIELMVVLVIMAILAGLAVPGIVGALRKAKVGDAVGAITRASAQARQLTRLRPKVAGEAYGVVIVQSPPIFYVAVTYGAIPPAGQAPPISDIMLAADGTPLIKYPFSRTIIIDPGNPVVATNSASNNGTYTPGANIGWVFAENTAYPVAMFPARPTPMVIDVLGMRLRTLDGRYVTGLDIYRIGLINAQDM